jgi:hypothetical protein
LRQRDHNGRYRVPANLRREATLRPNSKVEAISELSDRALLSLPHITTRQMAPHGLETNQGAQNVLSQRVRPGLEHRYVSFIVACLWRGIVDRAKRPQAPDRAFVPWDPCAAPAPAGLWWSGPR